MLIIDARNPGATAGSDAVESRKPLGFDRLAQSFPLRTQGGLFLGQLLLRRGNPLAGLVERPDNSSTCGAGRGQFRFLSFGSLKACEFFVFEPLGFGFGEVNFVFDRVGLSGCCHRVLLGAITGSLLTMAGDVPLEPGAQGVFATQRI